MEIAFSPLSKTTWSRRADHRESILLHDAMSEILSNPPHCQRCE
jgi:hypothetical protein